MAVARGRDVKTVAVADMLQTALSSWIDEAGRPEGRLTIHTDQPQKVPYRQASPFVMMMCELASEAERYGPLSERGGLVTLSLNTHPEGGFTLVWATQCKTAQKEGLNGNKFSSALIQLCASMLGQVKEFRQDDTGLRLEIHVQDPQ